MFTVSNMAANCRCVIINQQVVGGKLGVTKNNNKNKTNLFRIILVPFAL